MENTLKKISSDYTFRVIGLKFEHESEQLQYEKLYRLYIRALDNRTGLILEDFCTDCAKRDK
jgi:hypothetical protein